MKIILSLEFYTELKIGGSGSVLMFSKKAEVELNAYDIAHLLRSDGYITRFNMRIRPVDVKATDTETLTAYCSSRIHPTGGKLEDFKRLVQDGWIPNVAHAKAVRSQGYPDFFPDRFNEH